MLDNKDRSKTDEQVSADHVVKDYPMKGSGPCAKTWGVPPDGDGITSDRGGSHMDAHQDVDHEEVAVRKRVVVEATSPYSDARCAQSTPDMTSQEWFWSAEWQQKEREADAAFAAGQSRTFDDVDSFLADLDA